MNRHWIPVDSVQARPSAPTSTGVWTFVFRRKRTIMGVFVGLSVLLTTLLYLFPQTYVAEANLLVERNRSPIMRADYSPGLEMAEVMNTARGIASSRTVMEAVVNTLKLTERPERRSLFGHVVQGINWILVQVHLLPEVSRHDQWVLSLMQWVTIKPIVNSNILTISISHEDPELAAEIVNAISDQYVKAHLKIYSTRGLAEFYRERMIAAEAEYKEARQKVMDFKTGASLFAIAASREEYTRELGTLRTQLLSSTNDLSRLLRRYDPAHPEVTVSKDVITSIEARIAETEAKLKQLERDESTLTDLEMVLETRRKTYLDHANKYGEAAINEQADPDVVNVRLIEKASVPPQPWMPRLYLIAGAVLLSAMVAVLAGFLHTYFDTRPAAPDDVEQALGIPVVGWMADLPKGGAQALCTARRL